MIVVGVDTGGTFTDLIVSGPDGRLEALKVPSTPDDPARAILEGLAELRGRGGGDPGRMVHGSTVATNALLERKGVATALVATQGFTDVIAIGRQNRADLYDPAYRRPPCIVPDELRFGAPGRVMADGSRRERLDRETAREIAVRVAASGAGSVAVSLLFSFLDPSDELLLGRELAALGLPVSLSHEILGEFREFERTSTTVVNAHVSPLMARYLKSLGNGLPADTILCVMQSGGGVISAETAMRESVRTILSGPAGGVTAAVAVGRAVGLDRLITFDMGGTSTDVCLLDGAPAMTTETVISGYPVKTPMIDIHTVGAGGGSIASLDPGGALVVGPESAGADPGPVCHGRGTRLTVTDANLFLGRIIPERFLGGRMPLFPARTAHAMASLAAECGLTPADMAEGIVTVAEAAMERAVRVISVQRGHDPADFALLCFGGAGGLHAVSLARALGVKKVVVPRHPGLFSALGMLAADIVKDYAATVMIDGEKAESGGLETRFEALEDRAVRELSREGATPGNVRLERFVDMRYLGQSFELTTPYVPNLSAAFHVLYEKTYGYKNPDKPVQAVTVRLRATGLAGRPVLERIGARAAKGGMPPVLERRDVTCGGRPMPAAICDRAGLVPGHVLPGPAVIVEPSATTFLPPGAEAGVDGLGNLVIDPEAG